MSWFTRKEKGITTPTENKKDSPDGMWYKSPSGKIVHMKELQENCFVVPGDGYHVRVGSNVYFGIIFDNNEFDELDAGLSSADPLGFVDKAPYPHRLSASQKKSGLKDAVRCAHGKIDGMPLAVACMDFDFIAGSMGSVVGEKVARAIDYALSHRVPLLIISKSGGARMMEAGFSLMQMAKTSAKLALLDQAGIPFISLLTDPTTGGVTASFAMLGDFNLAEPGALIGFAGPRVIRETIGKDLPKDFQTAEFLLEHGFVDMIVARTELKNTLSKLLRLLKN